MKTVFEKLNLKDQEQVLVPNAPEPLARATGALHRGQLVTRMREPGSIVQR
jgi:hypothetical protein